LEKTWKLGDCGTVAYFIKILGGKKITHRKGKRAICGN